jgi:NAD(P)-dependent dehydrogenase (short-subunit alcohol dehydrogenase family)
MPQNHSAEKIVLITGAAQRIGRAIAHDLSRHGWTVAVHYNSSSGAAEEVVEEIAKAGGRAAAFQADLADAQSASGVVAACKAALGAPLCLINNASLFEHDTLGDLTPESWQSHLDVNLRAPVLLSQAFARELPSGAEGNIVNILDQRVWKLTPDYFSYTISKSALWTATRTMAQALSPRIRVNAIGPGPTLASTRQSAETFARQQKSTPLQRGAAPQEICAGVRFILDAPAMTGQMIALDGGQHLAWRTPDVDAESD